MKEKEVHRDAFEDFLIMGAVLNVANLKKLAEKFGVTERTIQNWDRLLNWRHRAAQRLIEIDRHREKETNKTIADAKADIRKDIEQYKRMVKQALANAIKQQDDGTAKITIEPKRPVELKQMVDSFDALTRLDLSVMGEADEKSELKIIIEYVKPNATDD